MGDIRHEIDRLDQEIISLLGNRLEYVHAAAKFKTSETSVRALDRVASMLTDRERWAIEQGLQPEPIRQLYVDLIEYCTEHELREWTKPRSRTRRLAPPLEELASIAAVNRWATSPPDDEAAAKSKFASATTRSRSVTPSPAGTCSSLTR